MKLSHLAVFLFCDGLPKVAQYYSVIQILDESLLVLFVILGFRITQLEILLIVLLIYRKKNELTK